MADDAKRQEEDLLRQINDMRDTLRDIPSPPPASMGNAVNGTGTMLLDYRKRGEGTYAATKWWTFFYFPLVPRGQYIVRPIRQQTNPMQRSYRFQVLDKESLDWGSVLKTYAMAILAVVPPLFAFIKMDLVNDWVGEGPGFFVTLGGIVWFVLMMFRFMNADTVFEREGVVAA
ncbi:MAG: hypothetical protein RhofKO_23920 [Rhodothermales bacterium]